jgi:hypothetical protein
LTELGPSQQAPPVRSRVYEADDEIQPARKLRDAIFVWFANLDAEERARLGMSPSAQLRSVHFHSSVRVSSDGTQRFGLVVQLVEVHRLWLDGVTREIPSGATLVIDVTGKLRFVIAATSGESRREALEQVSALSLRDPMGWSVDGAAVDPFAVDYRGMHEARA